ncbi:MAG: RDD family protein [Opitutae bacterium]|nr:RDD family protein [Opitutae bacterium]
MKDILGPRFGAFAIDYIVVFAVDMAYIRAVGQTTSEGGYQVTGLPALVGPGFWLLWMVVPEWLWGATLGKKILGLRVQKADGSRLGFGGALLRRVCDLFDFWMSFGLVATICHLKSAKGQRVGDMAAGAEVILQKKGDPVGTDNDRAAPGRV